MEQVLPAHKIVSRIQGILAVLKEDLATVRNAAPAFRQVVLLTLFFQSQQFVERNKVHAIRLKDALEARRTARA